MIDFIQRNKIFAVVCLLIIVFVVWNMYGRFREKTIFIQGESIEVTSTYPMNGK